MKKSKPVRKVIVLAECQGHTLYKVEEDGKVLADQYSRHAKGPHHRAPRIFRLDTAKFKQRYERNQPSSANGANQAGTATEVHP